MDIQVFSLILAVVLGLVCFGLITWTTRVREIAES
jgi:hypothetical protein